MNFTEFVDLVLARVYESDLDPATHNDFVSMDELAAELREPVPETWPFHALLELERRGLVSAMKAMGSSGHAIITGAGRLYVEQKQRETKSIIYEYRNHPGNFVVVSGTGHQVAVGTTGDVTLAMTVEMKTQALTLLDAIEESLRGDESLEADMRDSAIGDVQAARTQIEKPTPNTRAAAALLQPLAHIASIANAIKQAVDLLT